VKVSFRVGPEGFAPVSIISVYERREAKGLAHVPLIQRGDALMIPIWIASFSTCRCRTSARGTRFAPMPMMSLSGFAFSMPAARPCGLTRDDVDAYHRERRRDEADHRITAASWNRAVASLDRLYRWRTARADHRRAVQPPRRVATGAWWPSRHDRGAQRRL
jgi:hypothetical protein